MGSRAKPPPQFTDSKLSGLVVGGDRCKSGGNWFGMVASPAGGGGAEGVPELGGDEPVAAPQLLDLPGELLSRVLSRLDGQCFAAQRQHPAQHSRHALPGHVPPPLTPRPTTISSSIHWPPQLHPPKHRGPQPLHLNCTTPLLLRQHRIVAFPAWGPQVLAWPTTHHYHHLSTPIPCDS